MDDRETIFVIHQNYFYMSYSEEQQKTYSALQWRMGKFQEMKNELKTRKCAVHNKQIKVVDSWEGNYTLNVYISKYCCIHFAEEIKKLFVDRNIFDAVIIEPA
jgi:hypothetical protein